MPTTSRRNRRAGYAPVVAAVVFVVVAAHLLWPVLESGYAGDDMINSQTSAHLAETGKSRFDLLDELNERWMRSEGRFFPVAITEGVFLFSTVHDRALYKTMQLVAPLVVMILAAIFVGVLARNLWAGVATMGLLVPLHQFRAWYDPLTQFGLQQPSVVVKILGSLIFLVLAIRSRRPVAYITLLSLATLFWVLALLHYETTYFLLPVPILLVLLTIKGNRQRRFIAIAAYAIPLVVLAVYVLHLRSNVVAAAPGYTTRFEIGRVAPAFTHQSTGTFPMSYPFLSGSGLQRIGEELGSASFTSLAVGALFVVTLGWALWRGFSMSRSAVIVLLAFGGLWFFAPAALIASTVRWQDELNEGLAYIPVYQQTIGLALFLTGVAALLGRSMRQSVGQRRMAIGSVVATALLMGLAVPVTREMNEWVVASNAGLRSDRATFETAARVGFFDVLEGVDVASPHYDGSSWVNGPYLAWLGGPRDIAFSPEVPSEATRCKQMQHLCGAGDRPLWYLGSWSDQFHHYVLWIAPVIDRSDDPRSPVVDLGRARIFTDRPGLTRYRDLIVTRGQEEAVFVGRRIDIGEGWAVFSGPPVTAPASTVRFALPNDRQ